MNIEMTSYYYCCVSFALIVSIALGIQFKLLAMQVCLVYIRPEPSASEIEQRHSYR